MAARPRLSGDDDPLQNPREQRRQCGPEPLREWRHRCGYTCPCVSDNDAPHACARATTTVQPHSLHASDNNTSRAEGATTARPHTPPRERRRCRDPGDPHAATTTPPERRRSGPATLRAATLTQLHNPARATTTVRHRPPAHSDTRATTITLYFLHSLYTHPLLFVCCSNYLIKFFFFFLPRNRNPVRRLNYCRRRQRHTGTNSKEEFVNTRRHLVTTTWARRVCLVLVYPLTPV